MKRLAISLLAVAAGVLTGSSFAAGADSTFTVTRDSTMNALDYVLQRPAPSPRYEHKRFGDRLFLTGAVGPDWTRSKDGQLGATSRTGVRGGLSVGDWVSPV
ncbi:MAG: hypothetical protein NC189_05180, partial [Bacteroides sp.]|nr:hypothetical protein [Bacteroides sp.]